MFSGESTIHPELDFASGVTLGGQKSITRTLFANLQNVYGLGGCLCGSSAMKCFSSRGCLIVVEGNGDRTGLMINSGSYMGNG